MTLNDIVQSAQGGQGVQALGRHFGLSPEEIQSALQAILPALSQGLQRTAQDRQALGGVIGEMASGDHAGPYADPSQTGAAVDVGSGALGQIFGGPAATNEIAAQISRVSGLDPALVAQLLPAVASMALGGLAHAMQTQGHGEVLDPGAARPGGGGMLGSLVSAVEGALGGASGEDWRAGLSSLINMFQPGITAPPGHDEAVGQILTK